MVDHSCSLRDNGNPKDPDTVLVVDGSGVGKAVASTLHERGFFFHPVTSVAGDSVKEHYADGVAGR